MKKLSKISLSNFHVLEKEEMKTISGGKCYYSTDYNNDDKIEIVHGGAVEAEFMAGPDGWWCCNC
ncbi:TIGR04149 family rSAM-modified RiPP [Bacteroides sp.]|uniref:TIGR04149 family rSAM-modified RiPP n=1 Tax=Bacteroides sp. TaxID=29523 RepID=UPI00258B80D8|nr:TIGR04149 family rSAM-modified RiPP [Bacteroides sp.]